MIRSEPVVSAASVAGAIVALLSIFNVVLDLSAVETIVTAALPVVLSLLARAKVTPTKHLDLSTYGPQGIEPDPRGR